MRDLSRGFGTTGTSSSIRGAELKAPPLPGSPPVVDRAGSVRLDPTTHMDPSEPFTAADGNACRGGGAGLAGFGVGEPFRACCRMGLLFLLACCGGAGTAAEIALRLGEIVAPGRPETGAGVIEEPGGEDVYRISLVAGQAVYIDALEASDCTGDWAWGLDGPDGDVVFDERFVEGDGCRVRDAGVQRIPRTGEYRLRIHGDGAGGAGVLGRYSFRVVDAPQQVFALAPGELIVEGRPGAGAGRLEAPGASDRYTFNAEAGRAFYFDVLSVPDCGARLRWRCVDPAGKVLFDEPMAGPGGEGEGQPCVTLDIGRRTLERSGGYSLSVFGVGDAVGAYALRVVEVRDDSFRLVKGTTVGPGTPGAGAGMIESPGSEDQYRFEAAAGEEVIFDEWEGGICGRELRWRCLGPGGEVVFDEILAGGGQECDPAEPGRRRLSEAGEYRVIVSGVGDASGPYRFRLWSTMPEILADPEPATVVVGSAATLWVSAGIVGPLSYEWFHDGHPVGGVAGDVLEIRSAGLLDAGDYFVMVRNPQGEVRSRTAALRVVHGVLVDRTKAAGVDMRVGGDGLRWGVYDGVEGGLAGGVPVAERLAGLDPKVVVWSPRVDFPDPGDVVDGGVGWDGFLDRAGVYGTGLAALGKGLVLMDGRGWLRVGKALDLDPATPEIDVAFGVGLAGGVRLEMGGMPVMEVGRDSFGREWRTVSFESEGLYPLRIVFGADGGSVRGLDLWWRRGGAVTEERVPARALYTGLHPAEREVSFDDLPLGTEVGMQYVSQGIRFRAVGVRAAVGGGDGWVRALSPPSILGITDADGLPGGSLEMEFVPPGGVGLGRCGWVRFYLLGVSGEGVDMAGEDGGGRVVWAAHLTGDGGAIPVTVEVPSLARLRLSWAGAGGPWGVDHVNFQAPVRIPPGPLLGPGGERLARPGTEFRMTPKVLGGVGNVFSVEEGPGGMAIDSATGEVVWRVPEGMRGDQPLRIRVIDELGRTAESSWIVKVVPGSNLHWARLEIPATGAAGGVVVASASVLNGGALGADGRWRDEFRWLGEDGRFVGDGVEVSLDFAGRLAPGQSYSRQVQIRLPAEPGAYRLAGRLDAWNSLVESDESDNTVISGSIATVAGYDVRVRAETPVVPAGRPVRLFGTVVQRGGTGAGTVPVEIRLRSGVFERRLLAVSDAAGAFETHFEALPGEAGDFEVLAGAPGTLGPSGAAGGDVQARFRIEVAASGSADGSGVRLGEAVAVEPSPLDLVAVRGRIRSVPVTIRNVGTHALAGWEWWMPGWDWMGGVESAPGAVLGPGEAANTEIHLFPASGVPLGVHDGFAMIRAGGAREWVPLRVTIVDDGPGILEIDVVDEVSLSRFGGRRVPDARVVVREPGEGRLLADVRGDGHGEAIRVANLRPGRVDCEVVAPGHSAGRASVEIQPGTTRRIEVAVPLDAGRQVWGAGLSGGIRQGFVVSNVVEAGVPVPWVVVEPASMVRPDSFVVSTGQAGVVGELKVTNRGGETARGVAWDSGGPGLWRVRTPVAAFGDLPPGATINVPYLVEPGSVAPSETEAADQGFAGVVKWSQGFGAMLDRRVPVPWSTLTGGEAAGWTTAPIPVVGRVDAPDFPVPRRFAMAAACDSCVAGVHAAVSGCEALVEASVVPVEGIREVSAVVALAAECGRHSGECDSAGLLPECLRLALNAMRGTADGVPARLRVLARRCLSAALSGCNRELESSAASPELSMAVAEGTEQLRRLEIGLGLERLLLGDEAWLGAEAVDGLGPFLGAFSLAAQPGSGAGMLVDAIERAGLLAMDPPVGVARGVMARFIDRWNRTLEYDARGWHRTDQVTPGESRDFVALDELEAVTRSLGLLIETESREGFVDDALGAARHSLGRLRQAVEEASKDACLVTGVRVDRDDLFEGDGIRVWLEVENAGSEPIEALGVEWEWTDAEGRPVAAPVDWGQPVIEGAEAFDGHGSLPNGGRGKGEWFGVVRPEVAGIHAGRRFILVGRVQWRQGGTLRSVPLPAVPVVVRAAPAIAVDYFIPNPRTPRVEDRAPSARGWSTEFGARVRNPGARPGAVRSRTGELEIALGDGSPGDAGTAVVVERMALDGREGAPGFGVDFGVLEPGGVRSAIWSMRGPPGVALGPWVLAWEGGVPGLVSGRSLRVVPSIRHELLRVVDLSSEGDLGQQGFLVNDAPDPGGMADALWGSRGGLWPVSVVGLGGGGTVKMEELEPGVWTLTAVCDAGWKVFRVPDPTQGGMALSAVQRGGDGRWVPRRNAWIERQVGDPSAEAGGSASVPVLSVVDEVVGGEAVYVLTYALHPNPDMVAPESSVRTLPSNSGEFIPVEWDTREPETGATFDIFVSVDGGRFTPWLRRTWSRRGIYRADAGRRVAFYSIATDGAGNREGDKVAGEAATLADGGMARPTVGLPGRVVADEGAEVEVDLDVKPGEGPAGELELQLVGEVPPGMHLDVERRRLVWLTGEFSGPSVQQVGVAVWERSRPWLGSTGRVEVTIREINTAPRLGSIPDAVIREGELYSWQIRTFDTDVPADALSVGLLDSPVSGARLDPLTGWFEWRPDFRSGDAAGASGRRYRFVAGASDGKAAAEIGWTVMVLNVNGGIRLEPGETRISPGQSGSVPLRLRTELALDGIRCVLRPGVDGLSDFRLDPPAGSVGLATLEPGEDGLLRLEASAAPGGFLGGEFVLAGLRFVGRTGTGSQVVPLEIERVEGRVGDRWMVGEGGMGRVIVVGRVPLLELIPERGELRVHGIPGDQWMLERTLALGEGATWLKVARVQLDTAFAILKWEDLMDGDPAGFWRVVSP